MTIAIHTVKTIIQSFFVTLIDPESMEYEDESYSRFAINGGKIYSDGAKVVLLLFEEPWSISFVVVGQ